MMAVYHPLYLLNKARSHLSLYITKLRQCAVEYVIKHDNNAKAAIDECSRKRVCKFIDVKGLLVIVDIVMGTNLCDKCLCFLNM